jgi:hypothetical protein
MEPSTIRNNLTEFITDIADIHAKNLSYVFGETNSCKTILIYHILQS